MRDGKGGRNGAGPRGGIAAVIVVLALLGASCTARREASVPAPPAKGDSSAPLDVPAGLGGRAGIERPGEALELAEHDLALGDREATARMAEEEGGGVPFAVGGEAAGADQGARPGAAPVETWKRAQITPNTSRLAIGDGDELPLQGMQVQVRIDGFRARVLLDAYYLNDRDRRLEGTFQVRLPDEASPYYFAFGRTAYRAPDVLPSRLPFLAAGEVGRMGLDPAAIRALREPSWTEVKEARIVPRETAAHAYTETVRRRIDPALMEWAGAGVFRARVFPLLPNKLHRIVIGYDLDLLPAGEDLLYRLDLPSGLPACVADLDVAALPGVDVSVTPETGATRDEGRLHYRFESPQARTIALRLARPGATLLTGTDGKAGPYFAARFRPALPAAAAGAGSQDAIFLVDASLSANPERFNVWLKLLRAILDGNRDALRRFAVLFFNIEAFWWREGFADNTPGNVTELIRFAKDLALEGATDLERALTEAASPPWRDAAGPAPRADLFLLSDGAATWGEGDLYALSRILGEGGAGPLFAYRTGFAGTDARALAHLARESGGAVFSVVGEAEVARAARAHRNRPWWIERTEVAGGRDLLLAGRPRAIYPGQDLLLVGRGAPAAGAEVALTLRGGAADGRRRVVKVKLEGAVASELAPRVYGQVAVGQLEALRAATEPVAKAYATHFRVPGAICSLLMLESEEDYERYRIRPEEDAYVVKGRPASEVVAKALAEVEEALGDPKARFLAWLERMEAMPGVGLRVEPALRMALGRMPSEAFAVRPAAFACRLRTWEGVPGAIQEQLASRKLDYDAIAAEARRRLEAFGPADALKAASSLVESRPGDAVLARDVGFSAMEWAARASRRTEPLGQAYHLFRRVAAARPYEPQTYRAMARVLEDLGKTDLALAYYEVGLAGKWADRFGAYRRILGLDYLRFLRRLAAGEVETSVPDFAAARRETVGKAFDPGPVDLLVTITWNTDRTDVDLHVTEPTGETCSYKHTKTRIGGRITRDVTQGYGPEMYTLKKAVPGPYKIRVHFYGSDRLRTGARTKVYAAIYRGWGAKEEQVARKVVTLADQDETRDVATVEVEG